MMEVATENGEHAADLEDRPYQSAKWISTEDATVAAPLYK